MCSKIVVSVRGTFTLTEIKIQERSFLIIIMVDHHNLEDKELRKK